MSYRVDKLEIADQMLESAIEEFLDKKMFFVALNSAGVASEIYAKAIRLGGGKESQREVIDSAMASSKKWDVPESNLKEMKEIANHLKNGVKHFDTQNDRYIELDPEEEAMYMIAEAMANNGKLGCIQNSVIQRFTESGRVKAVEMAAQPPRS